MDAAQVEEHYRKNYDSIVNRIAGRLPDRSKALAEEVVQETYYRVLKYIDSYKPDKAAFSTWFNTILNNCANDCKTIERDKGVVRTDVEEADELEDVVNFTHGELVQIQSFISKYKPEKQKILELYYLEGLTTKEISECMGKGHSAVRMQVTRFAQKMAEEDET